MIRIPFLGLSGKKRWCTGYLSKDRVQTWLNSPTWLMNLMTLSGSSKIPRRSDALFVGPIQHPSGACDHLQATNVWNIRFFSGLVSRGFMKTNLHEKRVSSKVIQVIISHQPTGRGPHLHTSYEGHLRRSRNRWIACSVVPPETLHPLRHP